MKYSAALLLLSALGCANLAGQYLTGQGARMIIGQATFTNALPGTSNRLVGAAGGIAYAGDTLFIADSSRFTGLLPQNRRVLIYRQASTKFPSANVSFPAFLSRCPVCTGRDEYPYPADTVLGQTDFNVADPDPAISQTGMRLPTAVASDGNILVVADTENNRVLIWNSIPNANGTPADIVLGQTGFNSVQQPIVVTASSFRGPEGVWIQNGRLYVADTQNHRVLIWRTIPTKNNQAADIVLGQANFTTAPEPDLTRIAVSAKATALLNPTAVTSDGTHLFVTDLGFQRVLIFNQIPDQNAAPADVVIGEPDLNTFIEGGNDVKKMCASNGTDSNGNATYPVMCAGTLSFPRYALADNQGRLYIADGGNDRVLIFNSIPTTNGAAADVVLGQKDMISDQITDNEDLFNPNLQRSSADTIRTPTSLAWDGQNLYVADPFDRRVLVFTPATGKIPIDGIKNAASLEVFAIGSINFTHDPAENDQVTITITGPDGTTKHDYVYKAVKGDLIAQVIAGVTAAINAGTGDPFVFAIANPVFNNIVLTARTAGPTGNSITVTDALNPTTATLALTTTNPTGGGDAGKMAPGALVTIVGQDLAAAEVSAPSATNLPYELGNVEVYFDGMRGPLTYVSPVQINTQVPYEVVDSTSVTAWVRTTKPDGTVSISDAIAVPISPENPGIFAQPGQDPRSAIAFHANSAATVSILVDGTITAGNTGTITIGINSYTYTVQATDTLVGIRDNFIAQINSNSEEVVTAEPGSSFARITLKAKNPGVAGNGITVSVATSSSATLTLSPSNSALCCGNVADAPVTPSNPAVPGEQIYVYATGLGLVSPTEAKDGQHTGSAYDGPANNNPLEFVSAIAGAKTANVISAGALPGTVGLYKVIVELSTALPTDPVTTMTIAQSIYVSNVVSIPVVAPTPPAQ